MDTLTATPDARPRASVHAYTLLVTGGDDGLIKVLTTLRSRRYAVRDLRADLSGDVGRVDVEVEPDGRGPDLLLEQLRRVVAVVRADHA
ncbi:ACT domain-containing protein [Pseudonocardia sp. HH130630-07]|uniref:ACT domain-containing protein n=1 Tax=Pseudonocardia sp. HH130630-07 TaxID=1690815 RepID=UPI000814D4AF|nr:ACT domain-containing protein [Pseudonocardia sp. HH130630-07]ANY05508.1 hypothetical protein AFB00_03430 [Pseudonocardia sp. HH130630-07]